MNSISQKHIQKVKNLLPKLIIFLIIFNIGSCIIPKYVVKTVNYNIQMPLEPIKFDLSLNKKLKMFINNDPLFPLYSESPGVKKWEHFFLYTKRGHYQYNLLKKRLNIFNYLRKRLKEEGLPEELAFVAFVESSLNNRAKSKVKAIGLWQFMKYTGKKYGLNINWSTDDRLNVLLSTEAAIKYFKYLYNYLQRWDLVILAYNYGEYGTKRIIERFGYEKGFNKFPRESKQFLLKIKAMIQLYNNKLPYYTDYAQNLSIVQIKSKWSLWELSHQLHLPYKTLKQLNPQYKINYAINSVNNLIIPKDKETLALNLNRKCGNIGRMIVVRVKKGETIYHIAHRFKMGYKTLLNINNIYNPKRIRPGKLIYIPIKR